MSVAVEPCRVALTPAMVESAPRRVVFLNGPPGSGKDTAGAFLASRLANARLRKFASALKFATHDLYGLPRWVQHDHFEAVKNEPLDLFFGLSPRQAYIQTSEQLVKPVMGADFFGRIMARRIIDGDAAISIITDSGFAAEAMPIVTAIGPENCLLIRLDRDGASFKDDSRGYIDLPFVELDVIFNDEIERFRDDVLASVVEWLFRVGKA